MDQIVARSLGRTAGNRSLSRGSERQDNKGGCDRQGNQGYGSTCHRIGPLVGETSLRAAYLTLRSRPNN